MAQYAEAFASAEIDLDVLPLLSHDDLRELGVEWQKERHDILRKASKLYFEAEGSRIHPRKKPTREGKESECRTVSTQLPSNDGADVDNSQRQDTQKLESKESKPSGGKTAQPSRKRSSREAAKKPRYKNDWQFIPGSDFVVDRFKGIAYVKTEYWFLTHFHSDHYGGLTQSFNKGIIYCSPTTSRLTQAKLKVAADRLCPIPLDTPTEIAGSTVTFLDANHCPGSVMITFENLQGSTVLHTGDARLTPETYKKPSIEKLRGKGCILILDTTYCDPKYNFPPQSDVVDYVIDTVQSELCHPKTLFLFGTYGIGKERVFLEVGKRTQRKVYVSKEKMEALACMDLDAEEKDLLTTDHESTNLHAVEHITLESLFMEDV